MAPSWYCIETADLQISSLIEQGHAWRFIFIVPPDEETNFGRQKFEGDTDNGEWAGKVDEYVLGLAVGNVQNTCQIRK
jgi:hypothetical protein